MSITINRKLGSNTARMEWNFQISRESGKANQTFQLVHNRCTSEFNITCTFSVIEDGGDKISMSVSLVKILSTATDDYDKLDCEEAPVDCQHQPCSVLIDHLFDSINIFKLDIPSGTWKSEPFVYRLSSSTTSFFSLPRHPLDPYSWKSATIVLYLYIEFENNFSRGENVPIDRMTGMFVQQTDCDVQFTFSEDRRIGGHINILAAKSPVFAAMFQHEMTESKTGLVNISDFEHNVFREFLYYIYSGRITNPLTRSMVQSLYLAADKYDISDLKEECIDLMISHVRISDAIQLMVWGYIHSVDRVQEAALTLAAKYGREICQQEEWEILLNDYPELCLVATRRMIK